MEIQNDFMSSDVYRVVTGKILADHQYRRNMLQTKGVFYAVKIIKIECDFRYVISLQVIDRFNKNIVTCFVVKAINGIVRLMKHTATKALKYSTNKCFRSKSSLLNCKVNR